MESVGLEGSPLFSYPLPPVPRSRPVKWCTMSIAPSSSSSVQLAMSRGTTSSSSSPALTGGAMALASDSALM